MTQLNELRLSNLFSWKGHIHHVIGIIDWGRTEVHLNRTEDNQEAFICNDLNELSPIPLTEEWLLKFGFTEQYNKVFVLEIDENIFMECESGLLSILFDINIDTHECRHEITRYLNTSNKYVHQLQNLYFALTGKELTIESIQP